MVSIGAKIIFLDEKAPSYAQRTSVPWADLGQGRDKYLELRGWPAGMPISEPTKKMNKETKLAVEQALKNGEIFFVEKFSRQ